MNPGDPRPEICEEEGYEVFVVCYHPEPSSFNHAMFRCALDTLGAGGHEVRSSDLAALNFNPAAGRDAYREVADAMVFKQFREERFAADGYCKCVRDNALYPHLAAPVVSRSASRFSGWLVSSSVS